MSGEAAAHFGPYAGEYARFRPSYPPALLDRVAGLTPGLAGRAWEPGAGSGQATRGLAERMGFLVATDVSALQLRHAPALPRVRYAVAAAEAAPLDSGTMDLVAVSQALHWFEFERFFAEARRVSRPGGVLAVWTYGIVSVADEIDALVRHLYADVLGEDWRPERRHVLGAYETIPVPFAPIGVETFGLEARWTLADFGGYLRTWSAARAHAARTGRDAVSDLEPALAKAWGGGVGAPDEAAIVSWPLTLRTFRMREPA